MYISHDCLLFCCYLHFLLFAILVPLSLDVADEAESKVAHDDEGPPER